MTLAFMLFILISTLQVSDRFEDQVISPAEQLYHSVQGIYVLDDTSNTWQGSQIFEIQPFKGDEPGWLVVNSDSLPLYELKVSEFEDEQVLIEIFNFDSSGHVYRMEGCELLLAAADSGKFNGGTIGEFCGLQDDINEYLVLNLLFDKQRLDLQIESHSFDDQVSIEKKDYCLERLDPQ